MSGLLGELIGQMLGESPVKEKPAPARTVKQLDGPIGRPKSGGPSIDYAGQVFGAYTVLRPDEKRGRRYWICQWANGTLCSKRIDNLRKLLD